MVARSEPLAITSDPPPRQSLGRNRKYGVDQSTLRSGASERVMTHTRKAPGDGTPLSGCRGPKLTGARSKPEHLGVPGHVHEPVAADVEGDRLRLPPPPCTAPPRRSRRRRCRRVAEGVHLQHRRELGVVREVVVVLALE